MYIHQSYVHRFDCRNDKCVNLNNKILSLVNHAVYEGGKKNQYITRIFKNLLDDHDEECCCDYHKIANG